MSLAHCFCFGRESTPRNFEKSEGKIEPVISDAEKAIAEEEKIYRDAASTIQRRIQRLRDAYPHLPNDKYYYVMAMLNTAVEAVKAADRIDTQPYVEMIHDLEKEIDLLGIK